MLSVRGLYSGILGVSYIYIHTYIYIYNIGLDIVGLSSGLSGFPTDLLGRRRAFRTYQGFVFSFRKPFWSGLQKSFVRGLGFRV